MRQGEQENGGGAGTRTPDTGIMIPLLYQLSYTATRNFRGIRYCSAAFLSRKTYSLNRVSSFRIFSSSSFFDLQAMQYRARGFTARRLILISSPHSSHWP